MNHIRAVAAAVISVALLTGCNGDGDAETSSSTASGTATTSTDAAASATAGDVTFTTEDGLTLEGRRFGSGTDWVVLAHMRPASMESWFAFADDLASRGYTALAFNFRGYGASEGSGFAVDTDAIAAIDYAVGSGATSVAVVGASMGGTGAVAAAAARAVDALVTLSAPIAFEGVDGAAAMAGVTAKTLLVAAEGDQPYATHIGDYAASSPAPVNTLFLTGNAHGTNLFQDHGEELTDQIIALLESTRG